MIPAGVKNIFRRGKDGRNGGDCWQEQGNILYLRSSDLEDLIVYYTEDTVWALDRTGYTTEREEWKNEGFVILSRE